MLELQMREERERSLEEWRRQIKERIEDRKQKRFQEQEPLRSLYSKNSDLVVTEQLKKKQLPLYVVLNK
jgi:hypothetical protein